MTKAKWLQFVELEEGEIFVLAVDADGHRGFPVYLKLNGVLHEDENEYSYNARVLRKSGKKLHVENFNNNTLVYRSSAAGEVIHFDEY